MFFFNNKKKISLINIFIFILLIISSLILAYTHYKTYYIFESTRLSQYLILYICSGISILFFLFLLFFKNTEVKKNIILLICTLFFIIYVSEFFLSFFLKDSDQSQLNQIKKDIRAKIILEKYNKKIDTRSPLQVKKDLKNKGIDVSLLVTPHRMLQTDGIEYYENTNNDNLDNIKKLYPLSGISNTLYVGGSESGEYKFYTTDRYGFNNSDDDWDREVYIALIGDSYTHGAYLDFDDNFTGKLKQISRKSVLSLAQANNGPLLELGTLKEYGTKAKPEIILWMYYEGNDLLELISENKSRILTKYLGRNFTQNLASRQESTEKFYAKFVKERIKKLNLDKRTKDIEAFSVDNKKDIKIVSIIKLQTIRKVIFTNLNNRFRDNETKKSVLYFKKIIREANEHAKNMDAKFYFVYLPSSTRFLDDFNYYLKKKKYFRKEVINAVQELDIKIIDIYDILFKNDNDPLSNYHFKMHSHYNKKAIEKISLEIYKQINIDSN